MWILTSEYNDYDQHGGYFEDAWYDKPTVDDIKLSIEECGDELALHIINGGGRRRLWGDHLEDHWYNLFELNPEKDSQETEKLRARVEELEESLTNALGIIKQQRICPNFQNVTKQLLEKDWK